MSKSFLDEMNRPAVALAPLGWHVAPPARGPMRPRPAGKGIELRERSLKAAHARLDPREVNRIIRIVAEYCRLTPEQLLERDKHAAVAWPRQVLHWLLRTITGASLKDVGRMVERDHGTILHNCRAVEAHVAHYPAMRAEVDELRQLVLDSAALKAWRKRKERAQIGALTARMSR